MPPLVTICSIAYNQEKFIGRTLEGFAAQRADFEFEAIVADDRSTDGTADAVRSFSAKHPGLVRPILREKNLGMKANLSDVLTRAEGKYIALCDGDDYWTDPDKLRKQAEFLEAHPDYAICFHPVSVLGPDGRMKDGAFTREVPETTDIRELAGGNYIPTASVMFRNIPAATADFARLDLPYGDHPLHLLNAQYGKIKKLGEKMAVYRQGVGVWTPGSRDYYAALLTLCGYFRDRDKEVHELLLLKKRKVAGDYLRSALREGRHGDARSFWDGMDDGSRKELLSRLAESGDLLAALRSPWGWLLLRLLYRCAGIAAPADSRRARLFRSVRSFVGRRPLQAGR